MPASNPPASAGEQEVPPYMKQAGFASQSDLQPGYEVIGLITCIAVGRRWHSLQPIQWALSLDIAPGPQKALCGGIPGDGFGVWGRFWSHFEGNSRQKMTNLPGIDF